MRSLKFYLLIVAFGIPAGLQAMIGKHSESSIYAVNPGYLVANKVNTVIVTGKNLSGAQGCVLIPAVGDPGKASSRAVPCISATAIPGTDQVVVEVNLDNHADDVNYILILLKAAPNPPGNTSAGSAEQPIPAPAPPAQNPPQGTGSPTANQQTASNPSAPNGAPDTNPQPKTNEPMLDPSNVVAYTVIHARGETPNPANPARPNSGNQPGQASPFASCLNSNADPNGQINPPGISGPAVNCASSLLTDGEVKDNFGGHVNHTYFALQVRISNQNTNNDFLLRDILLTLPDGRVISSRVRRFAQGVALKGKSLDIRAGFYNSIQAAGSLYGALSVFASPGFQAAGNALQGSFLAGFAQIFPDYTTENVNRFNNAVFDDQSPSIVPKDSIGQPPLYVVALVPKPAELKGESLRYYERSVAVSIEGTFIKQVSLVTLSSPVRDFGSEYISPDYAFQYLADSKDTKGLQLLRDAAKANELQETIMNNNSTPMNITGLKLITNTPSSTLSKSPDFEFDVKKTDCGRVADKDFDPQAPFSVPAQGFCTLWLYFHPNGLTDATATLQLLGNNLDGPTTFALKGKSIGILVQSSDIQVQNNADPVPVACSFAKQSQCSIALGNVQGAGGGATISATIPIFVINSDTKAIVTPKQDGQQAKNGAGAAVTCTPFTESDFAKGTATACQVPLTLDPAKGSTTLTLSDATSTLATYTVTYQTKSVAIAVDPPADTPTGSDLKLTGSVNDTSGGHVSDGTIAAKDKSGNGIGKETTVGSEGKFSLDLGSNLAPGAKQTLTLTYTPKPNSVYQSGTAPVTIDITEPPDTPSPQSVTAGPSVSVTLTLKAKTTGTPCNGTLKIADPGGANALPPVTVTNGSAPFTLKVAKQTQKKTLTFTPTAGDACGQAALDWQITGR